MTTHTQQYQVITGTLNGPTGQSQLLNTVLKGEEFRFDASVQRNGLPVAMHFIGKVVDGNLAGTIDFAGAQSTKITAVRAK